MSHLKLVPPKVPEVAKWNYMSLIFILLRYIGIIPYYIQKKSDNSDNVLLGFEYKSKNIATCKFNSVGHITELIFPLYKSLYTEDEFNYLKERYIDYYNKENNSIIIKAEDTIKPNLNPNETVDKILITKTDLIIYNLFRLLIQDVILILDRNYLDLGDEYTPVDYEELTELLISPEYIITED